MLFRAAYLTAQVADPAFICTENFLIFPAFISDLTDFVTDFVSRLTRVSFTLRAVWSRLGLSPGHDIGAGSKITVTDGTVPGPGTETRSDHIYDGAVGYV